MGSVSSSPRAGGSGASQTNGSRAAASSGLTPIQRANADRLRQRHLYFGGVRADDLISEVPHSLLEPHEGTRMGMRSDAQGFPTTTPGSSPAPYSRSGSSAIVPPGALRSISSGKEAFGAVSANRSLSGGRSGTVGGMTARRKSLRKVEMNRNVRSFIDNEVLTTTPEISTASSRTVSDVESVIRMGNIAGEARRATQLYRESLVSTFSRGKGIQRVAPSGPNNVLCSANAVLETSSEHAFGFERVQPRRLRQATAASSSPLSHVGNPPSHSSSLSEPSVVEGRPLGAVSVSTEEDVDFPEISKSMPTPPPTVSTLSRVGCASRVASSQSVAVKVAPAALDSRGTQYSRQASLRHFVEAGIQAHMEPTRSGKGTEVGRVPSSRVKSEVVEAGVQAAWIPTPEESNAGGDDDSAASPQAVTHILVESASSLGTSKNNSDVNRTTPSDQSVESLRDVLAFPSVVPSVLPTPSGLRDVGTVQTVPAPPTTTIAPTPSTLRELAPLVKPLGDDEYLRPFSLAASISRNPSSVRVHPIPSTSGSHSTTRSTTVPDAASLSSIAPTSRAASTLLNSSSDDEDEDLMVLERRVEALYRYRPPASSAALSSPDTSIAKAVPSLLTSTASSNSLLMRVGSNMVPGVDTRDVSGRESLRDLAEQIELQEAEARARDEEVNRKKKLLHEQFQQRQLQEQENVERAEPQTRRVAPAHAVPRTPGELTPSQPSHQVSHEPSREASVDFEVHYVSQPEEAKVRRSISETRTNPIAYVTTQPSADPSALSEEENEGSSEIEVEEVDLVSYVAVPQNMGLLQQGAVWHRTTDEVVDAAPIDPCLDDGALTHSCDACGATNMRGFYCRRCGEELAGARPKECVVCYELAAERYRREAALVRPRGAELELANLAMAGAQQQRGKYCSTCGGDLVEMGTERDRRVVTVSPSPFRERLVSESVATRSPLGPTSRHHADPQPARPEWIDATGFNTTQASGMGLSEHSASGRNLMNIWYTSGQKASHRRGLGIDDERTPSEASGDPLSSSMEAC